MFVRVITLLFLIVLHLNMAAELGSDVEFRETVLVVMLARNKEHTLPLFLLSFQELNYPKDKMSLFIRSDHIQDSTNAILKAWLEETQGEYHSVNKLLDSRGEMYQEEFTGEFWGFEKNIQLMVHRETALNHAREQNFDYAWFLDIDVFIRDQDILQKMIKEDKMIVAPMLESTMAFSNFWGDMTERYGYKRSPEYIDIVHRRKIGCFKVSLVNSCVLVNLKNKSRTKKLSFFKNWEEDSSKAVSIPFIDFIQFALNAKHADIDMYTCNKDDYGYILLPTEKENKLEEIEQMKTLGVKYADEFIKLSSHFNDIRDGKTVTSVSKGKNYDFNKIYCINLARRPHRKEDMISKFTAHGIQGTFFSAIDWKEFNDTYLRSLGIKQLKQYDAGDMTYGALGTFLSHYYLWEDIVENNYEKVIIFEDDVDFHDNFDNKLRELMEEIKRVNLEWDLIFLGRKPLRKSEEETVSWSDILVKPSYSHWAIGYMLSYNGAKKLIDGKPLNKMVPVDEYIPIMYGKHPTTKWSEHFNPRDLKAYSIKPLIVEPTHYWKEDGYISDTTFSPSSADVLDFKVNSIILKEDFSKVKIEL